MDILKDVYKQLQERETLLSDNLNNSTGEAHKYYLEHLSECVLIMQLIERKVLQTVFNKEEK